MENVKLPRLPRDVPIVDADGRPTIDFQRWWQRTVERIEAQDAAIVALDARVTALEP